MEDADSLALALRAQAVKKQITIYQGLERIGVTLTSGHYTQQIVCPFHHDRRPSARVYEDHVHCFTCGESWDVIDLVQKRYALAYPAAIAWLEGSFELKPATVGLVHVIGAKLKSTMKREPPLNELYQFVEARLIGARDEMSLARYNKLSFGLDLLTWQFVEGKQITAEVFRAGVLKILALVDKPSVGATHVA